MRNAVGARDPNKPALVRLEAEHCVRRYDCAANNPAAVERQSSDVARELGSASRVGQQTANRMLTPTANVHAAKGTIIFTNASAAQETPINQSSLRTRPTNGAFAMARRSGARATHGARVDAAGYSLVQRAH